MNNNPGCEWDGGDCCGNNVNKQYCSVCSCLDPNAVTEVCGSSHWKGDGYCDDDNNNAGCDFDGGDCCGDNVKKEFCTECKCYQ